MTNKIIAWTWLIIAIITALNWLTMPKEDYWLSVLVYYIGNIYLLIKYIESLQK